MRKHLITCLALVGLIVGSVANAGPLLDIVTKGSVDRSVTIHIADLTDGSPETGVVFNTSGIDLWYRREGAALTPITEATLAALTTAHTDGGFLHIANGDYRLDLPDAAYATGANYVDVGGTVTGMVVFGGRVRLVDYSLEDGVRGTAGTALPNAAAGASGGVLISGANSGTTTLPALTITGTMQVQDGIVVTRSTGNSPGVSVTGSGTGHGMQITGGNGATGNGLHIVAASTNGNGINAAGTGTGSGAVATGGATGHGVNAVGGSTSGNGMRAAGTAGNSAAVSLVGQGSAAGLLSTGGATGAGAAFVGGATSGPGVQATATSGNGVTATGGGTGHGVAASSGSGATGNGINAVAASTNGNGVNAAGSGTGSGLIGTGGATGDGIEGVGGATSGAGVRAAGTAGNSAAMSLAGQGSAAGLASTGGATGPGMLLTGGATSGLGMQTSITAPSGSLQENGLVASGTLSGTHSPTQADLGANAPASGDLVGALLHFPDHNVYRSITAYNTGTGVATFASTAATLANGNDWYLYGTASATGNVTVDAISSTAQGHIRDAVGLTSANLETLIAAIDDAIDTEIAAIKAKTDQLTFGVTNTLNVNVEYMNANEVCGTGDSGTPWTGCP